jgi:hypothetical protein
MDWVGVEATASAMPTKVDHCTDDKVGRSSFKSHLQKLSIQTGISLKSATAIKTLCYRRVLMRNDS